MAATPCVRALSIAMRMARSVTTKPKPQLPLMTAVQGASRSHHEGRAGDDVAHVDALGVGGNLDNAVGVVAHQVGLDQVGGHRISLGVGRAFSAIYVIGRLVQVFGREDGHGETSETGCFASAFSCRKTAISLSLPSAIVQNR